MHQIQAESFPIASAQGECNKKGFWGVLSKFFKVLSLKILAKLHSPRMKLTNYTKKIKQSSIKTK